MVITDAEYAKKQMEENITREKEAQERIGRNIYMIIGNYKRIDHLGNSKEKTADHCQKMGKALFEIDEDLELLKSLKV